MSDLQIQNVGPITNLAIHVPKEGGVVVFRGRNGSGKSVAIDAVDSLLGGKKRGDVSVRDTAVRGSIEGWGATLTVSRSTRISGELEVDTLEGRMSLADFISPKIKDPSAADATRIKALVQISGRKPDMSTFEALLGDEWEDVVTLTADDSLLDPVELAGKVKRACEAEARKAEKRAEVLRTQAKGATDSIDDVDTKVEHNDLVLRGSHNDASQALATARAQVEATKNAEGARALAREKLAEAKVDGASVGELTASHKESRKAVAEVEVLIEEIKSQLVKAGRILATKESVEKSLAEQIDTRKKHDAHLSEWEKALEAEIPFSPDADKVAGLVAQVNTAQDAIEKGAIVRRCIEQLAAVAGVLADAKESAARGERMRDAARGTEDILSDIVSQVSVLRIEGGRLIHNTQRGPTFFAELSDGERTAVGMEIAFDAVGKGGVLALRQDFWEGLDPSNRADVNSKAKSKKVLVLTAEAADGEIRAEVEGAA